MNDYKIYLSELLSGKDSLKLVRTEIERCYKTPTLKECYNMGIGFYQSDNLQIEEVDIFLLGYFAYKNENEYV